MYHILSFPTKMEKNYYSILECKETATQQEIKRAYQRLVKQHHPDKHHDLKTTEFYNMIDEAWRILRDPENRKQYDAKIMNDKLNNAILIYDTLYLQELQRDEAEDTYSYKCRCGGIYSVNSSILDEEIFVIRCNECSFYIKVVVNIENPNK